MEKQQILFDWDDTLFSKQKFIKNLCENLGKECDSNAQKIEDIEKEYVNSLNKSGDFRMEGFLNYLENKVNNKFKLEHFISNKLEIYSRSLFEDTVSVLSELRNNFDIGIYSQGYEDFQKTKIESSGIKKFFDDHLIYIDKDKLNPAFIQQLPTGATIIDDKKEVIEELKTSNRFNLIWINRKNEENIEGVKTIRSLKEVVSLISETI